MASKSYFVYIEGVKTAYGPYALASAKDFARIGSQFGENRCVTRGRARGGVGTIVRVYSDGERVWPVQQKDLVGLKSSEWPREFR